MTIINGSLHKGETRQSAEAHQDLAFEPEWIEGRFACLFGCHHCEGKVAVAGKYRVADERHYDPLGEAGGYVEYFRPLFFSDPPHIVTLPESTPQTVKDDLIASFRLFWSDSDAAANRIRASVEHLLTALRVNRTSGRGNARGSRQFLTLHERIRRFRENEASLADHLLAVKWLGNVGSHPGGITQEDVLDGYEIIQYVLDELYIRRSHRINRLSRAINRRRGPRSPRRGSA